MNVLHSRCVSTYVKGGNKMVRLDCGHSRPISRNFLVPNTMACPHCTQANGGHNES